MIPMKTTNVIDDYPVIAEELMGYATVHKSKFYSDQKK